MAMTLDSVGESGVVKSFSRNSLGPGQVCAK
jgi:hypothetical protein